MRLARYASKRLVLSAFTLLGMSAVTFLVVNILPGDVAVMILGTRSNPERLEMIRQQLGLNRPLWIRYLDWLGGFLTGNLGTSLRWDDTVLGLILDRLPASAFLAVVSLSLAVVMAIPLGIIAAMEQNTWKDFLASVAAFTGISVPNFFWGMVLILIFAVNLDLLPPSGYVNPLVDPVGAFQHITLPAFALAFGLMAHITRMTRSSLLEELRSDYIKLAQMKGLTDRSIVFSHALPNAFLPVLTVIGFQLGFLFGGIVVIEQLFGYPGLGRLGFEAMINRDTPVIQAVVLVIGAIFLMSNLAVDLLYAVLDPRIGSDE